ncbi:MAG: tetratricopeptide repeat protein [Hyphomicrobiaceae bacterium]
MATKDDIRKSPLAPLNRPAPTRDASSSEAFEKEVDEEIQRERMNRLWQQYRNHIFLGAAAIVLAVAGYKWFEARRIAASEARGERLAAATKLLRDSKNEDAAQKLAIIAKDGGPSGVLAGLRLAAKQAQDGKTADAVASYEAVAKERNVDPLLSEFAQLQSAMLKLDTADWTDMQNRLNALTMDTSAWRHSARELLGLAAMKANRPEDARTQFEKLLADRATPQGISERARIAMATMTAADLAKATPVATETKAAPAAPDTKAAPAAAKDAKPADKAASEKTAPAPTKK